VILLTMIGLGGRRTAVACVFILTLSSCALLRVGGPPSQGGNPTIGIHSADAFLQALANHDAENAWSHLTEGTRHNVYDDNEATFAHDVADADWSGLTWQFGPVTNLDWAWGVHVIIDEEKVPTFLVEREIAAGWEGFGIVLHVVTPNDQPYLIAAQGVG
jgi:hypothetical protein